MIRQELKFNIKVGITDKSVSNLKKLLGSNIDVNILVSSAISKKITRADLVKRAKKVGQMLVAEMILRIYEREDKNLRKFRPLTRKYKLQKAKKINRVKGGSRNQAGSVDDDMRLSGKLLDSIKYKVGKIKTPTSTKSGFITIILYIAKSHEKQAKGLQSSKGTTRNRKKYSKNKRQFFGYSIKGLKKIKKKYEKEFTF